MAVLKTFNVIKKTIVRIHDRFQVTDFTISTWLLLGAALQSALLFFLPRNLAFAAPILLLICVILRTQLVAAGYIRNAVADGVVFDRWTVQYPSSNAVANKSGKAITVLVLGASMAHPEGRFSGNPQLGKYFEKMWKEANEKRERYGYLGNTPALIAQPSDDKEYGPRRGDDKGTTMIWLSYWSSLDGLHAFANEGSHLKGATWWEKVHQQYPYIGLMHEVYEVPAGNWENVFSNFRPFAIGNARFPVQAVPKNEGEKTSIDWVSGSRSMWGPDKKEWKNMTIRLGRKPGSVGLPKEKNIPEVVVV